MLLAKECRISESVQLLLSLPHQRVKPGFHVGQLVSNVVHKDL